MISDPILYLILWVSGSGKTTILQHIIWSTSNTKYIQSYTTRPIREGEKNGQKYFFVTEEEFKNSIVIWEFIEYAHSRHQKYRYGTKKKDIVKEFKQWYNVIKEMDILWLQQILKSDLKASVKSIFLYAWDQTMIQRLMKRWDISLQEINQVIVVWHEEIELAKQYCDYIVDTEKEISEVIDDVRSILYQNQY